MSTIERETNETKLKVSLSVDPGAGSAVRNTGEPFLDHMLDALSRYAGLRLELEASGDMRHHLVEDVAITLGMALREEIPPECRRYGHAVVPMDDALVEAAIDVGGRPYYAGRLPSPLYEHFLRSLAMNSLSTLHIRVLRGRDRHHIVEAAFKATGLALREALSSSGSGVFSTKGVVRVQRAEGG